MEMRMMRKDDEMNMIKAKKHHHIHHPHQKSQTLPPSPTHSFSSSSSSDFEFTISLSPRKSSNTLCPADELFYRGQLLPLHLSPRLSMVRTLLVPSSTSSFYNCSSSETTTSRDSTASSSNESRDSTSSFASDLGLLADQSCGSSRPSSVAEDTNDESFKRLGSSSSKYAVQHTASNNDAVSRKKYFSLSRFSSVFKKEPKVQKDNNVPDHQQQNNNNMVGPGSNNASSAKPKRMSLTAKEVFSKYFKKVKPLYEKLSQKQQQKMGGVGGVGGGGGGISIITTAKTSAEKCATRNNNNKDCGVSSHGLVSQSFSGNLRYPRRRGSVSSCPSSMRCSPREGKRFELPFFHEVLPKPLRRSLPYYRVNGFGLRFGYEWWQQFSVIDGGASERNSRCNCSLQELLGGSEQECCCVPWSVMMRFEIQLN